jgi:hypothetical protein
LRSADSSDEIATVLLRICRFEGANRRRGEAAMDFELFVALFCVIGIGWLTIVPTYRGWGHLEEKMAERVETTIAALDEPD